VALARLLRQEPLLLLADEPLASLDPRLADELLTLLLLEAKAPRALLLSLHRPDLLSDFDRVVGLRAGRIVFDAPPGAIDPSMLQALYAGATAAPAGAA
jgi:phosphonate transport system ATP-binding protein